MTFSYKAYTDNGTSDNISYEEACLKSPYELFLYHQGNTDYDGTYPYRYYQLGVFYEGTCVDSTSGGSKIYKTKYGITNTSYTMAQIDRETGSWLPGYLKTYGVDEAQWAYVQNIQVYSEDDYECNGYVFENLAAAQAFYDTGDTSGVVKFPPKRIFTTMPEEIKELYLSDSIRKNIRIHFPNGERADITNSNIDGENFSFTESLCSRSKFKLGLCEASVVKFTCVDIEDIKGCTIEVYHEIDVSGLPADLVREYGTKTDDVAYPHFQWPYGTFVVSECPRQSDMRRRKVVAYSAAYFSKSPLSKLEQAKQSLRLSQNIPYTIEVQRLVLSNIPNMDMSTYKTTAVSMSTVTTTYSNDSASTSAPRTIVATRQEYRVPADYMNRLYTIEFSQDQTALEEYAALLGDFTAMNVRPEYLAHVTIQSGTDSKMVSLSGGDKIYPYIGECSEYGCTITVTTNVEVLTEDGAERSFTFTPSVSLYYYSEIENNVFMSFPRIEIPNRLGYTLYAPDPEINFGGLLEPWLELNGLFGGAGRNGKYRFYTLEGNGGLYPAENLYPDDDLYPTDPSAGILTRTHYTSAWYDDEQTKPYDKVEVTYTNTAGDTVYACHWMVNGESESYDAANYQSYSLSDNYLIQNTTFTAAQISAILSTVAERIKDIRYMPANVKLVGMPWVEAGDGICVLTRDGGFETFILRRTLKGIQSLKDNFVSK